ncbi:MAG: hypothetical protein U5K43_06495 [Halofilum sp. (in: g-proteobacteria)]|nr:hypothetical protein [Halofilum sp. (in: g-proteobacteria)]
MLATLWFVGAGHGGSAAALFALATVGFMGANALHDALLVEVAPAWGRATASRRLGFALGYLGGGLLFAACVALVLLPQAFGFADAGAAVRFSFLLTAAGGACSRSRRCAARAEPPGRAPGAARAFREGARELAATLRDVGRHRDVWRCSSAGYFLYIDCASTPSCAWRWTTGCRSVSAPTT